MGSVNPNNPVNPIQGPITNINTTPEQLKQLEQYYQANAGVTSLQNTAALIEQLEAAGSSGQISSAVDPGITPIEQNIVNGLLGIIHNLQHYTTASSAQVPASLIQQLQSMAAGLQQTPPQMPSDTQLNSLSSDLTTLNSLVTGTNTATQGPNFPPQAQSQYWDQQATFFQNLGSVLSVLPSTAAIQQVYQQLNTQSNIGSPAPTPAGMTPDQLGGSMTQVLNALSQLGSLNPQDQNTVLQQLEPLFNNVNFNAVNSVPATSGAQAFQYSGSQVTAYSLISQWTESYVQANPNGTAGQLQTYLQQQSQSFFSSLPQDNNVVSSLQNNINSDLQNVNYSQTLAYMGLPGLNAAVTLPFSQMGITQLTQGQLMQNLGIFQTSQAPHPPVSQQMANVQTLIAYTDAQLKANGNGTLSQTALTNILAVLPDLANATTTSSDQQAASLAANYLDNTEFTWNSTGENLQLTQLAAYAQLAQQANAYVASASTTGGSPTAAGLQTYLQNYVNSLPTAGRAGEMQAYESNLVNPSTGSFGNPPFQNALNTSPFQIYVVEGDPTSLSLNNTITSAPDASVLASWNQNQISVSEDATYFSPSSGLTPPQLSSSLSPAGSQVIMNNQSAIQNLVQQAQSAQIAAAVQKAIIDNNGGKSLQNLFSDIILEHYMPGQESLLQNQADQLNYTNWLGQQYTSLVSTTSTFSSANTVLNFGQRLSQPGSDGTYNGSATAARSSLQTEESYVADNQNNVVSAINQTQTLLNDLNTGSGGAAAFINNPQLATQIATLKTTLKNQLEDLQSVKGQLDKLQNILLETQVMGSGNSFSIATAAPGFPGCLTDAENTLINGGQNSVSLSQVAQDINTQSQQTTSQSQTQQMSLQLSMTEIQQEWSVVSSALQILNQVYMSFAQGISQT